MGPMPQYGDPRAWRRGAGSMPPYSRYSQLRANGCFFGSLPLLPSETLWSRLTKIERQIDKDDSGIHG